MALKLKKCLIITCVYPPEPVVSSQTSFQIAQKLLETGAEVSVLSAFPNRPDGKLYPSYSRKLYKRYDECGIEVIRCFSTLSPQSTLISRFMENMTFGLTSGLKAFFSKRPDVIYSNTWPLIATGIIAFVAKLRGIPLVISVQDIYPESLLSQERLGTNHFLVRLMRWIDCAIARHSSHIIVISDHFAEIYIHDRKHPTDRLSIVPNWIAGGAVDFGKENISFRSKLNIGEKEFLLVYGGNVGVAAGVESVIKTMGCFERDDKIRFLVAGSGSSLQNCRDLVDTSLKDRVLFHSPWLSEETSDVLLSADLLVLPTQGEQSLVSVPSKLLFYMLAGKPVITTAVKNSSLADFIVKAGCGWVVEPGQPDLMAAKIKEIMKIDKSELKAIGLKGRDFVLKNFTKEVCLPKILKILDNACH